MTTKNFELALTDEAAAQIQEIESARSRQGLIKQLKKALKHLAANPGHPGLQSHPITQFDKVFGGKVFSSYVQNNTPQAHRILWLYGPKSKQITIVSVTPHY
jgi:hypothetical protein